MEFIIIQAIVVIMIIILGYVFDYNMKKIKKVGED